MFRNRSVDVHQFAMVPRAEIPRSRFRMQKAYKTTFDASLLIPIFVEEVLPGDTFQVKMTAFARLATPIFPIMDNMYLDSFFFFVPNRLVWTDWKKFNGEQVNPGDSISFTVPQNASPVGGFAVGSIGDYMGLPTVGQVGGAASIAVNTLPFRAYYLIYNEWFRDENLINSFVFSTGAGPDSLSGNPLRRGKRHDYFTSCLPFVQKGTAVSIGMTGQAVVKAQASPFLAGAQPAAQWRRATDGGDPTGGLALRMTGGANSTMQESATTANTGGGNPSFYPSNLYADLSTATANTINALRLAFQTQKLLERDARGGTRYTEIVRSHFGVISPDARLQRPEYLGGGSTAVNINPVIQSTQSGLTGGTTKMGSMSGFGTALAAGHGFTQSFTEHGYIIGIVSVRADLTYQQGLRRHWSRLTRYDFYWPVFAALGEQAVLNKEIYCIGTPAQDDAVFGYNERWAEYRYNPSQLTGLFRSTSAGTLDPWHLSQKFTALPVLNSSFIEENVPTSRIKAVTSEPDFIFDSFFDMLVTRPMPMYSVPGLIDHF
ncbi:MAG: major capsid protein [Microviridae sp.]|nr:MAG: major capsid protein [Microviridae sp.]